VLHPHALPSVFTSPQLASKTLSSHLPALVSTPVRQFMPCSVLRAEAETPDSTVELEEKQEKEEEIVIHELLLPEFHDGMEGGKVVEWYKKVGDEVTHKEVLCDVETEFAIVEFHSDRPGYLASILRRPSDVLIPVGEVRFSIGLVGL